MNSFQISILVIIAALIIDRIIGDPKTSLHPVALLGKFIGVWGRPEKFSSQFQIFAGIVFWFVTVVIFLVPFFLISTLPSIGILLLPVLLKITFSWRALEEHVYSVEYGLNFGLYEGKKKAGMLVSRNTSNLSESQVRSAAYESLTENLVDSITAPLFFFLVFGILGAGLYRAANTMDAMLGYRDEREKIGKFSARIDDILTYIPARITACLLLVYFSLKGRFTPAYNCFQKDRYKRPGMNGGLVMAVMAGGNGIRFEKPGVYIIGEGELPDPESGKRIISAFRATVFLSTGLCLFTLLLLSVLV